MRTMYKKWRHVDTWEDLGLMGDSLSFTDEEIVNKQGLGYTKHLAGQRHGGYCNPMDVAVVFSLLDAGEGAAVTAKSLINPYTSIAYFFQTERIASRSGDWWYHKSLRSLYRNERCSYYWRDSNQFYNHTDEFIKFDKDNARWLMSQIVEKDLLKEINKCLTSLKSRGRIEQVTHGRNRTFEWKGWDWLYKTRSRIITTGAKKRKLGDIVNGWEYTQGRVDMSYGMEIHNHEWVPTKECNLYFIEQSHYSSNVAGYPHYKPMIRKDHYDSRYRKLPYYFLTEDAARAAMMRMQVEETLPEGAFPVARYMDDDFNTLNLISIFRVRTKPIELIVEGAKEIEQYPTPTEVVNQLLACTPEKFVKLNEMFTNKLQVISLTEKLLETEE